MKNQSSVLLLFVSCFGFLGIEAVSAKTQCHSSVAQLTRFLHNDFPHQFPKLMEQQSSEEVFVVSSAHHPYLCFLVGSDRVISLRVEATEETRVNEVHSSDVSELVAIIRTALSFPVVRKVTIKDRRLWDFIGSAADMSKKDSTYRLGYISDTNAGLEALIRDLGDFQPITHDSKMAYQIAFVDYAPERWIKTRVEKIGEYLAYLFTRF